MKKTFQSALIFSLVIGQLHATAALPQENTPQIAQKSTVATPVLAYLNKKQTPASLAVPIISGITGALSTGITALGCFILYSPERTERLVEQITQIKYDADQKSCEKITPNFTHEQYADYLMQRYGCSPQEYERREDAKSLSLIKYITITVGAISVTLVGFTVYKAYQYFKAKKAQKAKTVKQQTV